MDEGRDWELRRRVAVAESRIPSQHRQLDELYAYVTRSLEAGAVHSAREGFRRFCEAAEAHLTLEEQQYFSALAGLAPRLLKRLEELCVDHEDLRMRMRELSALLDSNERELSRERLIAFAEALSAHEAREEQLVGDATSGKPD